MQDSGGGKGRRGRPPKAGGRPVAPVKALERGLALLDTLESSEGLTLSSLARNAQMTVSTTHRLLTTLQTREFVRFDHVSNTWSIGVRAFEIGQAFARQTDLVAISRPTMVRLMQASEETVSLGRFVADEIVFVAQVETKSSIRAFLPPGERGPLHASGCGKAILATWPDERVSRALRSKGMPALTSYTITDIGTMHDSLKAARVRGWSINDEEHTIGMRCVAAPIFDSNGQSIAAISVSGPSSRVSDDRLQKFGLMIREAAVEITSSIGGSLSFFNA
jgi:IclR family transcriptional regulator, acetate operon repressor